jgi:tetratricopeptide (TPR) repeat protein
LVSVSKHLYILKDRRLKYQKKKMDYDLRNFKKSDRELVVHYLITDHLSGVFYAEIHSSKKMIPVEEFLYRAWSEKENFEFCGLPTILSVPKTLENEKLLNLDLIYALDIEPINPRSGFMGGVKHLNTWEKRVLEFEWFFNYENNRSLTFEELQESNLKICIDESQNELREDFAQHGTKIEQWMQSIKKLILPPPKENFFSLCQNPIDEKSSDYPPVRFEIFKNEDDEQFGQFIWGEERTPIKKKYLDFFECIEHGVVKGLPTSLMKMTDEDHEFIGTYLLLGLLEYGKRNLKKAIKHLKKAVEIGDTIIPKNFKGYIVDEVNGIRVLDNKDYLDSLIMLGKCFLKTGNAVNALSCFERLIRYCPSYKEELAILIADASLQAGDIDKAKTLYSKNRENTHGCYGLGLILFKEGNLVDAISTLRTGIAMNPYVVEMLIGTMEMSRKPRFGSFLTEYGYACDYVENNLMAWKSDDKSLDFLKLLYHHPMVFTDARKILSAQLKLDQERYSFSDDEVERLKNSALAKISVASSLKIRNDLFSD